MLIYNLKVHHIAFISADASVTDSAMTQQFLLRYIYHRIFTEPG